VQSADAFRGANLGQKPQRAFADSPPAMLFAQVKFINERVAPMEFQAVAERQYGVSGDLIRQEYQKHMSERFIDDNGPQCAPGDCFIELQPVESVELAHHRDQYIDLIGSRGFKDRVSHNIEITSQIAPVFRQD